MRALVLVGVLLALLAYPVIFGWFVLAFLRNRACTVNDDERIWLYYHD